MFNACAVVCIAVLLSGCSAFKASVSAPPTAPAVDSEAVSDARDSAVDIAQHIKAYIDSDFARFEQPEISAVMDDLATVGQETDPAKFLDESKTLSRDWDTLLALDDILQQESVL